MLTLPKFAIFTQGAFSKQDIALGVLESDSFIVVYLDEVLDLFRASGSFKSHLNETQLL
jgi:hypothetical protein